MRNTALTTRQKGFTLIELLVVIGIIGILAAVVLVAVNPGRQFGLARDSQRNSDLYSITLAVYQYAVENNGQMPAVLTGVNQDVEQTICYKDALGALQPAPVGTGCLDLSFLVPKYIPSIPQDPGWNQTPAKVYKIKYNANNRLVATANGETDANNTPAPTPITVTR